MKLGIADRLDCGDRFVADQRFEFLYRQNAEPLAGGFRVVGCLFVHHLVEQHCLRRRAGHRSHSLPHENERRRAGRVPNDFSTAAPKKGPSLAPNPLVNMLLIIARFGSPFNRFENKMRNDEKSWRPKVNPPVATLEIAAMRAMAELTQAIHTRLVVDNLLAVPVR